MASTVDRYTRQYVTLPDGRTVAGRMPGHSGRSLLEHQLRDVLARQIRGVTEATLPYGRADVLTATTVFEVEPLRTWRNGVRQALAYTAQCGLPPAVALFGNISRTDMLKIYLKLRDSQPPVELWWFADPSWLRITSRTACRTIDG